MKSTLRMVHTAAIALGVLTTLSTGCSSMPWSSESGKDISATGPTVMNVRSEPSTVEMTPKLQPVQRAEILADVKDFSSKVTKVTLKFVHVPIQVAMKNVGGTTWQAELTPQQLKTLAVSGKTIKYDAIVEAVDEKGLVGTSGSPFSLAIRTPELGRKIG